MATRFTTPVITCIVRGIDLTGMDAVTVSLRQRIGKAESTHAVDVTDPTMTYDGTDTTITVPLTQEQAGGFVAGASVLESGSVMYRPQSQLAANTNAYVRVTYLVA